MENLTIEQQRALALARARKRKAEEEAEQSSGGPSGIAAFAGSVVPAAIAGGVDLMNMLAGRLVKEAKAAGQAFGQRNFRERYLEAMEGPTEPLSSRPFMGSESMRQIMSGVGLPMTTRAPETVPEHIGQFFGETATAAVPMMRGAQLIEQGGGVAGRVAGAVTRDITERPARALSIEAGASVAGGTFRAATQDAELGPFSQAFGELGSAMAGGVAASISPVNAGMSVYRWGKSVFPFTEAGAMRRASKRIQEVVQDPVKTAAAIDDLRGTALMASARTEEPGLMAIEKAVLSQDPSRAAKISHRNAETTAALVQSIRQSGSIDDTRKFIAAKRERLVKSLEARIEQAGDQAAAAVNALGADATGGQVRASVVVRNALESALADARVQEAMLWQAIPQGAKAPVAGLVSKYKQLRSQLSSSQLEDMPVYVSRAMGIIKERKIKKTTIQELDGLYKKLGEVATASRASGERNKARIAEEMRESIWETIGRAEGGEDVREAVDTARGFSSVLNEKFHRGSVGKILGHSREGGAKVAPEKTLDLALGPARAGLLGSRQLQKASDSPLVLEGVQDYLKAQFARNAVVEGRVSPQKAESFFRQNAELLDSLPALKNQLQAARSAEDVARRVTSSADAFRKAIDRPEISATARFLQAPVDQEISRIMTSSDPARYFKILRAAAIKEKNGEAMQGLKAGLSEWLIGSATSPSAIDVTGRSQFNGMKLKSMLQEPRVASAMQTIYSKKEIENITKLADMTAKLNRQARNKESLPIISDIPSKLLEIPARILGARVGARMASTSGGSIQAAAIGSDTVKGFLRGLTGDKASQLIIDAIDNPDLMKALLLHTPKASVQQRAAYERSIRAYMVGPGARLVDAETRAIMDGEESERRKR